MRQAGLVLCDADREDIGMQTTHRTQRYIQGIWEERRSLFPSSCIRRRWLAASSRYSVRVGKNRPGLGDMAA